MKVNLFRHRLAVGLTMICAMLAGTLLAAGPAHAAYGAQLPVSVGVSAYSASRGSVSGWVQFDDGRTQFRYELTFCRNSSFSPPTLEINVNNVLYRQIYHNGGGSSSPGCSFAQGVAITESYGAAVSSVQFIVVGSSFNQNVYRVHRSSSGSSYGKVINPYY